MGLLDAIDKRRKTKIPIKNFPPPVEWMLKNATFQQLDYLDRMVKSSEFPVFVNFISRFKEYNVYEIYRYQMRSPEDLAYFRSAKVGEVAGLDALILACQGAGEEIKRRKRMKEGINAG